ncbi:MAG: aminotransferase class I/II-fold pyridoxal phosphate-dependent enzyme [Phycisphaerales bacterium]|nr:aminotransferase class I/II-fold pyridoxal phosphate-dependent enzyme [Phycisphaerales bacterium]
MTSVTHPLNARLAPFGESIFTTMSRLAIEHKAVNLGQGFPDFEPPAFVRDAALRALGGGFSQYSRAFGLPETTSAIARYSKRSIAFEPDPDREVTVTAGCTEAIAAVLLGTLNAGDEVVILDPSYDSYAACVAMAGAVARRVRLEGPAFRITEQLLRPAFSSKTRAILLNSPHNPTGRMFDSDEYAVAARLAQEFDCLVLSDEVYDEITYARSHTSIAQLPGMRDRTVVLGSMGKTFSCTGWKIGWTIAPPEITRAIRGAHQFLTFCAPTPLQKAAADALQQVCDDGSYLNELRTAYATRRARMLGILSDVGFECVPPEGSYFILANAQAAGWTDDVSAAKVLVGKGVATIPASAFFDPNDCDRRWLRFAFCKQEATMALAESRLKAHPLSAFAKFAI